MNPTLRLLLSDLYPGALAPEHLANILASGLFQATIALHKLRSVPPDLIDRLLGFKTPKVMSAYLLPFPSPDDGGWFDHVRLRIFPAYEDDRGGTVKYLQPKGTAPRLYFPIPSMAALRASEPVYLVEGERKSLAVAQLGLPAVGFAGIEGWHTKGSADLLPDFSFMNLKSRAIEFVPDGDVVQNVNVRRGAERFAAALRDRGAQVRLVRLPEEIAA